MTHEFRPDTIRVTKKRIEMIIVRTETWTTRTGAVIKAVVRDEKGKLVGATNSTRSVAVPQLIVGK